MLRTCKWTGADRAIHLCGHVEVSVKVDTDIFDVTNRCDIFRTDTYSKYLCHLSLVSWDDWQYFRFGVIHL